MREFFFGAVLSLQDLIKIVSFTLEKSDDLTENEICFYLFSYAYIYLIL
jgi:hypothetical protein